MFSKIPWQDMCKFLAGAFFETSGILFYLWLYRIPMPIFGTRFVQTPELAGFRALVHTVLFCTCFYLGFMRKWQGRSTN